MDSDTTVGRNKRPRENESPSQRLKREKAAERQRRKRERDRAGPMSPMPFPADPQDMSQYAPEYLSAPPQTTRATTDDNLTPEEQARRDRVRAAARERQRKHRMLVKQRKMRELGMDMGNEIMPPVDDPAAVHYRVDADGQYQQVIPPELQHHHLQQAAAAAQAQAQAGGPPQGEPPFPQGPAHGGQTFATTLLLSFSCAPLLKQHLLRTLSMTNEELASLEPVIAEAWDRWDAARRGLPYEPHPPQGFPPGYPGPYPPPGGPAGGPPSDDFRGRFQRVMTVPAPFPFANGAAEGNAESSGSANESGNGATGAEAIDPHLGSKEEDDKADD